MIKITPVLQIVIICFVFGGILKHLTPVMNNIIPYILAIFGGIILAILHYTQEPFTGIRLLDCIATGMISGLASTGSHQVYKTLKELLVTLNDVER